METWRGTRGTGHVRRDRPQGRERDIDPTERPGPLLQLREQSRGDGRNIGVQRVVEAVDDDPLQVGDLPFITGSNLHPSKDVNDNTNGYVNGNGQSLNFRAAKAATLGALERSLVVQALEQTNGNITHAARLIGKPRRTFFELMRKYQISARKH